MEIDTIGIDLEKTVYHLVGLSAAGEVVVLRKVSRTQLPRFYGEPGVIPAPRAVSAPEPESSQLPTIHHFGLMNGISLNEFLRSLRIKPIGLQLPSVRISHQYDF